MEQQWNDRGTKWNSKTMNETILLVVNKFTEKN